MGLGADPIVDTGMKRCVVEAKCTKLLCISQQECANTVHVGMGNGQANCRPTPIALCDGGIQASPTLNFKVGRLQSGAYAPEFGLNVATWARSTPLAPVLRS